VALRYFQTNAGRNQENSWFWNSSPPRPWKWHVNP